MAITEGNVRVTEVPIVTIGDKPLQHCSNELLTQTFLQLLRRIDTLRKENEELRNAAK